MAFWKNYMYRRERWYHQRDNNRLVRPLEWGLPYIVDHVNGDDPRELFRRHTARVMQSSDDFYSLPEISDYRLEGDSLTWTSAIRTPSIENNTRHARFFPAKPKNGGRPRNAVVVLPQWNAQPESHVEACRIFNFIGMSALRLTLPYHLQRKPPELERADHLVSTNIGRSIQSMRQAVLDTRAAVRWLKNEGYERVGILGHERRIVYRVSGVCARAGSERGRLQSRFRLCRGRCVAWAFDGARPGWVWRPVDVGRAARVLETDQPVSLHVAHWPTSDSLHHRALRSHVSTRSLARCDRRGPAVSTCRSTSCGCHVGHYTTGELPWKAIDAWKIATFFRKQFKD
jgi:hypothetical protein